MLPDAMEPDRIERNIPAVKNRNMGNRIRRHDVERRPRVRSIKMDARGRVHTLDFTLIYTFTCARDKQHHTYDIDLSADMAARKLASENQTCIRVETAQGRVVWRRPLSDSEMREIMTRGKLRTSK
jgi:hypothetical protein